MPHDTTDDGLWASRRTFLKATGAATAVAATGAGVGTAAAQSDIDTLLEDLSLEQKAAQMTQVAISSFEAEPEESNVPDSFGVDTVGEYFSELGIGSILSGGAEPPSFDANEVVQGINALQEHNLENADHDIPFLYGVDATHGNGLLEGATVFPQRLNMGTTRDLSLIAEAERHTSDSTASMGAHWTFAPTTDLQRDPRWGRFFEGISEDPKLEADVSRVRARALEDDDRLTACVKHFAAYSVPNNGNDRAPASTSMRDLRTNILPPYREALAAEPGTVMVNSGSINGIPAHASHWLLTTLLRDTYGYEGMVVSDWDDLNRMITNHDYAPDFGTATEMAINAGIDMYMIGNGGDAPGPVQFIDTVVGLVEDSAIPMERIDEAVRRILELKADLGLFDQPTVDESRIGNVLGGAQDASETMAKESMVLLKNDADTLPLSGDESVLLTGPGVDGDGNNTRALMQHGGWTLGWQGASAGGPYPRQNLLEAELQSRVGSLTHVPTSYENTTWWAGEGDAENQQSDENGNFDFTDEQRSQVESAAPESDAVVVVIGEGTHNEGFGDRDELVLDESQRALLDTVVDATDDSAPIIGVMLAGAPRGSPDTFSQLDALLFAGQPGSDGGVAVAETLVGESNPSGKLPFSWPENVGTTPVQYNRYDPTSTGGTDNAAVFEYGHGLSYTDFEYGSVSVTQPTVGNPANQSEVTVSVEVTNTGEMAGEHIVEMFNTQSYGSVLQPMRRLLGYERVSLDSGESTTVDVTADLTALEVVPGDVLGLAPKVVEAGEYELTVGQDGPTTTLTVQNTASITDPDPVPGLPDRSGGNSSRGNGDSGNGNTGTENSGNGNENGNSSNRDPTMGDVVDLLDEVRQQS